MTNDDDKEEKLIRALSFAISCTAAWQNDDGFIDIPELIPELRELQSCFVPIIERRGWAPLQDGQNVLSGKFPDNEKFKGYYFQSSDEDAEALHRFEVLLRRDPRAYDLFVNMVISNLAFGQPLEGFPLYFTHMILDGKFERPRQRAQRPPTRERDALLFSIIERVHELFGFHRASRDFSVAPDEQMKDVMGRLLPYGAAIAWVAFETCEVPSYGTMPLTLPQVSKISANFQRTSLTEFQIYKITRKVGFGIEPTNALAHWDDPGRIPEFRAVAKKARMMFTTSL